jgi:hypothetical protein
MAERSTKIVHNSEWISNPTSSTNRDDHQRQLPDHDHRLQVVGSRALPIWPSCTDTPIADAGLSTMIKSTFDELADRQDRADLHTWD